jgi:hypothetical protein
MTFPNLFLSGGIVPEDRPISLHQNQSAQPYYYIPVNPWESTS